MNEKNRAFTLIELLIVVAIIAILAAIAVPNFLEAQVRSKVSRAQSDMRSLATALESYAVDNAGKYPVSSACALPDLGFHGNRSAGDWGAGWSHASGVLMSSSATEPSTAEVNALPMDTLNCNYSVCLKEPKAGLVNKAGNSGTGESCVSVAAWRQSFTIACTPLPMIRTLTTPTAYITSYPADPFADTKGLVFGYTAIRKAGWILWSYGPDCDEMTDGEIGSGYTPNGAVVGRDTSFPYYAADSPASWQGVGHRDWGHEMLTKDTQLTPYAYTYDSTNGSRSYGDVYRLKQ